MAQAAPGALSSFIGAVETELGKLPGQMVTIGQSMAIGIWNGLQQMLPWLKSQIQGFINGLVDGAKRGLRSTSPSMVFSDIWKTIPQGLAHGMNQNAVLAMTALLSMFNQMNNQGARLALGGTE